MIYFELDNVNNIILPILFELAKIFYSGKNFTLICVFNYTFFNTNNLVSGYMNDEFSSSS